MRRHAASLVAAALLGIFTSAAAVPPPPVQLTADCDRPGYASDMLVCADPELRELDLALARLIAEPPGGIRSSAETHEAFFRRSRMCAFEVAQRDCLLRAYCTRLRSLCCSAVGAPAACGPSPEEFLPAAAISRSGFARPGSDVADRAGEVVRLWGYVDFHNVYGDAAAREILGEWWGGAGPDAGAWRFDLKAQADDGPGESFAVHVPNDCGRDDVLRLFRSRAEANRALRVYLEGRVLAFDAPTGGRRLTGLRMELDGANSIRFAPSSPDIEQP